MHGEKCLGYTTEVCVCMVKVDDREDRITNGDIVIMTREQTRPSFSWSSLRTTATDLLLCAMLKTPVLFLELFEDLAMVILHA